MAVTTQDITVYRGEKATLNIAVTSGENITGWTLLFTVARKKDMATKLFQVTGAVVSGVAGTLSVALTTTHTNQTPDEYAFDLWRTDAGYEQLLALGGFIVAANVRVPTA